VAGLLILKDQYAGREKSNGQNRTHFEVKNVRFGVFHRTTGKIVRISRSKTYDLESCNFQAESSVALDILRYADVPSVDVLENKLPVGCHALRSLCFRQVFDDLNAVSGNFIVEQERL